MNFGGARRLEEASIRHRAEVRALQGDLRWMVDNASDEQLLVWAKDAGKHFAEMEDAEPDWQARYTAHLMDLTMRLHNAQDMLVLALNDQEWDVKISGTGDQVKVTGKAPTEQIPALMYRLAARYAEQHETTVEESLRLEVELFRRERDEAREETRRLKEKYGE